MAKIVTFIYGNIEIIFTISFRGQLAYTCKFDKCKYAAKGGSMDGKKRADIKPGMEVDIVLKKDQRSGKLTRGIVKDILTKSPRHPHGIKVRLVDGQVGRIKRIITS